MQTFSTDEGAGNNYHAGCAENLGSSANDIAILYFMEYLGAVSNI